MKTRFLIPVIALMSASFTQTMAADDGANLFKAHCAVCHTIGNGRLVGPDLKGVENRHSEAWLLKWIPASQKLVQSGDKDAVKLFTDNSSIPMPDQPLSPDEVKTVLAYIKSQGQPAAAATPATAAVQNNGPDNITVATQKAAAEQQSGSLLTAFSFTEYMLMFLMGILLIIVYVLGMSVKSLSEKLKEEHSAQ